MFKNYLKTAWRNLVKQKGIAFINIFGLSVGLACFILFLIYSLNEFSFDRFHKNGKNLYRVYLWHKGTPEEGEGGDIYMPMPLGPAMKQDLSGVEQIVRFRDAWGDNFIRTANGIVREKMAFADPDFFSVFSFPLKKGQAQSALRDLHSVVLTEATAEKLFGKEDPVGKLIEVKIDEEFVPFTVTAVAENPPSNSSIQFTLLGNFHYLGSIPSGADAVNNWHRAAYVTYVLMRPGAPLPTRRQLIQFRNKYYDAGEQPSDPKTHEALLWFGLQPVTDMHTDTRITGGAVAPVEVKTIWILLSIAFGVLLIACINFTTLSIGRSAGRSKEVGIRKVVGSDKRSLTFQFLIESLLLSFLSALTSFVLIQLLLPAFNLLSGKTISFSIARYPALPWFLIGLIVLVGLFSGIYPALVLSRFRPVEVLKTRVRLSGSNFFTRSLVTFQFVLSAALIISTLVITRQWNFMRSKNPGFNKENVIVVDADGLDTKKIYPLFRSQLLASPEVVGVASAEISLGEGQGWSMSGFKYKDKDRQVFEYFIDPDYLRVLGLQLLRGRNFDPANSSDTVSSVIVNESLVREFGWTLDNAVGQPITGYQEKKTPVVIGVVRDFNFLSFSEKVRPQLFHEFSSYQPFKFFIRTRPGDPSRALAAIGRAWKTIVSDYPLQYSFLDQNLERFYQSEQRWSRIVGWAGGISIFLACLGLLGLTMLAVVNRTKEIGIRKVLGASISQIVTLLSSDFLKLVLLAFVIAAPIAWYFMYKWLQDFAYRIEISWTIFLMTAISALLIAFITISFQALKAALANPVKSLRTE